LFALHTHVANPPLSHSLSLPFAASSHIFLPKTQNRFNLIDVRRLHASRSNFQVDVVIGYRIQYKHSTKCNSVSLNVRCVMLQAQGQNAMQFKCVQMSLDDSQTLQQTLVQ